MSEPTDMDADRTVADELDMLRKGFAPSPDPEARMRARAAALAAFEEVAVGDIDGDRAVGASVVAFERTGRAFERPVAAAPRAPAMRRGRMPARGGTIWDVARAAQGDGARSALPARPGTARRTSGRAAPAPRGSSSMPFHPALAAALALLLVPAGVLVALRPASEAGGGTVVAEADAVTDTQAIGLESVRSAAPDLDEAIMADIPATASAKQGEVVVAARPAASSAARSRAMAPMARTQMESPSAFAAEAPMAAASASRSAASTRAQDDLPSEEPLARIRRSLETGVLPPVGSVRTEEVVEAFDYAHALPADGGAPFEPTVTVLYSPWNAEALLVHVGLGWAPESEATPAIEDKTRLRIELDPTDVSAYRMIVPASADTGGGTRPIAEIAVGRQATLIYEVLPARSEGGTAGLPPSASGAFVAPDSGTGASVLADGPGGERALGSLRFDLMAHGGGGLAPIEMPLTDQAVPFADAPEDVRFSIAAVAFARKLGGDAALSTMSFERIASLARGAQDEDRQGRRAELARLAEMAADIARAGR